MLWALRSLSLARYCMFALISSCILPRFCSVPGFFISSLNRFSSLFKSLVLVLNWRMIFSRATFSSSLPSSSLSSCWISTSLLCISSFSERSSSAASSDISRSMSSSSCISLRLSSSSLIFSLCFRFASVKLSIMSLYPAASSKASLSSLISSSFDTRESLILSTCSSWASSSVTIDAWFSSSSIFISWSSAFFWESVYSFLSANFNSSTPISVSSPDLSCSNSSSLSSFSSRSSVTSSNSSWKSAFISSISFVRASTLLSAISFSIVRVSISSLWSTLALGCFDFVCLSCSIS
mmetsp:Transcript_8395/g.16714  ORF Transcript_8395/g.16714 Transcript_8395/m.16714 type:complete len:294 (-) Transcript_8395:3711-4592(-)